eukprot:Tamp_24114.p1 GENE.Tamp_24114~~Tamp_24114.p1  ORF type:complete len:279 (+),score=31.90 Tamp_24114:151-987(+)
MQGGDEADGSRPAAVWSSWPSVVTWAQPDLCDEGVRRRRPVAQAQKKERLTVSQRMRQRLQATRFMQQQFMPQLHSHHPGTESSSSADSSPAASPMHLRNSSHLSPPAYANFASGTMHATTREVPSLEQLCLSTVASNLVRLREGCMDLLPDYLRYALYESVRKRNPLLLHGQTLRALVCGSHFTNVDLSNASNLSDADLVAIAPSLEKATKLKMVSCHYVNEDAVATALRNSTSLTDLRLELNSKVTGAKSFCPDYRMCSLTNVFSIECVLLLMCSL